MINVVITAVRSFPQRVRDRFARRPDRFIIRIQQQCELNVEAAGALLDYMGKPSKKNAQRVQQLEKNADEIRRMLVDELNRTFVSPIDGEDIYALSL